MGKEVVSINWMKEIRAVGFDDWCWFVIELNRNEFHPNLRLLYYAKKYGTGEKAMNRLIRDRQRAHEIDLKLQSI